AEGGNWGNAYVMCGDVLSSSNSTVGRTEGTTTAINVTNSNDVFTDSPNPSGLSNVQTGIPTVNTGPISFINANLRKLEVNVPNDADYDVWLPLSSIDEVND
nr:hypothetical protein [Tanacetum cinerariifolium]